MTRDGALNLQATVTVPEDVLWQQVEDRVILLDLRSNEYHSLNDSGSRMWMLLMESDDVAAALECLQAIYDVDEVVLSRDLAAFIGRLTDSGLLESAPR